MISKARNIINKYILRNEQVGAWEKESRLVWKEMIDGRQTKWRTVPSIRRKPAPVKVHGGYVLKEMNNKKLPRGPKNAVWWQLLCPIWMCRECRVSLCYQKCHHPTPDLCCIACIIMLPMFELQSIASYPSRGRHGVPSVFWLRGFIFNFEEPIYRPERFVCNQALWSDSENSIMPRVNYRNRIVVIGCSRITS